MKRFLITTALEETWRDDMPVLFLGEWCRLYSRRSKWAKMDATMLPYHWDDRARLHKDYLYLKDLFERLLCDLTSQLNERHGVDRSTRYWRILIGPWLGFFIQVLFDRWTSIQEAVRHHEIAETVVVDFDFADSVPRDMREFYAAFPTDLWNHWLYGAVLKASTTVPVVTIHSGQRLHSSRMVSQRSSAAALFSRTAAMFRRDSDVFLMDTSLSSVEEMRLHWKLGQIPQRWTSVDAPKGPVDVNRRQWVVDGTSSCAFETCARALIPRQIPSIYLEGYPDLAAGVARLPWPRKPRAIWTSNAQHGDDMFKAWAADKVEHGTPLAVGQHGGHYGVGRWSFNEDHEIAIADRYLTWGWDKPNEPKIKPVGMLLSRRALNIRHSERSRALLITATVPRYSYWMYSVIVARQWLDYFEDQCTFVEHLSPVVREALTVRLYCADYGWDQAKRWADRFRDVRLDSGSSRITKLIRQTRVCISTYNATSFYETFAMNVPTVLFWNPSHWEIRESAVPSFNALKDVGILHDTPEGAARHLSAIWDDVDRWWRNPTVSEARARVMRHYGHARVDLLDRVASELRAAAPTGLPALCQGRPERGLSGVAPR